MKVVYAPNYHFPITHEKTLYLAGGVAGCLDWQADVIKALEKTSLTIFNPRRQTLLANMPELVQAQREWEFGNLSTARSVLFWFPKESLCPSTNYELGACLEAAFTRKNKGQPFQPLFIGVHPDHSRYADILSILMLHPFKPTVSDSVKGLVQQVKNALKKGEIK
jgi:nucleoside 2-deoxyribosyltransferase-like protein